MVRDIEYNKDANCLESSYDKLFNNFKVGISASTGNKLKNFANSKK
jgi:hypothetical protein